MDKADKEVIKEIQNARKEAIDDMLKDIGFLDDEREKVTGELGDTNEEIKQEDIKSNIDLGESKQQEKKTDDISEKSEGIEGVNEFDNSEALSADKDEDYIIKIYRKFRKVEKKTEIDKTDKINLSKIASNLNIIGKIKEKRIKKQEDYKKAIANTISKKENLVNKI